jgi:hypothetical protein
MRAVSLRADAWADYFRAIRRECGPVLAIVSLAPDRGGADQSGRSVERTLRAIRYDPGRDVLELSVGGVAGRGPALRYFISAPREILVKESPASTVILIEDAGRHRTAVGLRRVGVGRDRGGAVNPMDLALDMPQVAGTHFVDRVTWRTSCPRRRPVARRTCRTYMRGMRRGTI